MQNKALSVWKPVPSCLSHTRESFWYNPYQLWTPWSAACIPSLCPLHVALELDAELTLSCENMDVSQPGSFQQSTELVQSGKIYLPRIGSSGNNSEWNPYNVTATSYYTVTMPLLEIVLSRVLISVFTCNHSPQ